MKHITFITGNISKVTWLQDFLDIPIDHKHIDLHEIQSLDVEEIVKEKVKTAFSQAQQPVLVDDTSLVFHAMNNLPGPLVKWFLQELGNEGLCRLLDKSEDRTATATVMYGFYDGETLELFSAEQKGSIADRPKGEQGFGWDSIFIPDGCQKTWAEMDYEEQRKTSLRGLIIPQLQTFLQSYGK